MFGLRFQIFRAFGIPISVDISWLVILGLLTVSLANFFPEMLRQIYGEEAPQLAESTSLIAAFFGALAFFGCILLHELGHALVARRRGMSIRGITLFLFGGVAELGEEPPSAWTEFWVAIAGPLVTLGLIVLLSIAGGIGMETGWPPALVGMLVWLGTINLIILVFNMIPAFPLDGGRVLRSILWGTTGNLRNATWYASQAGRLFSWMLIGWGVMLLFTGNIWGGLWAGLIGLFLNNAALGAYQQVVYRQALEGEPVRRFMNASPITVEPTLSLADWVENYVYRHHRKTFPVLENGRLVGCIDTKVLSQVPRDEWDRRTVGEYMREDWCPIAIDVEADAMKALGRMQRSGSSRLLVTQGDALVGILSMKDLMRFLELKLELEDDIDPMPGSPPSRSGQDREASNA